MKVVVVHNRYRSAQPSGENDVVDADIAALRADGVEVIPYLRSSDEVASMSPGRLVSLTVRPVHSFSDVRSLDRLIDDEAPDVMHVHNVFPLVSPSVVRLAARRGVAVVQTVHNFRHRCVSGISHRDGAACTACHDRLVAWPAVRHGCYQGSALRTVPMAAAVSFHRSTWRLVDRFLVCGDHLAEFLVGCGVPGSRIEVRRNSHADPGEPAPLGDSVLYVGRLVDEKGIRRLLDAWPVVAAAHPGVRLRIAGDGTLRDEVAASAAADPSIEYLGLLEPDALAAAYRASRLVVVPSQWPEPDPISVVAALAHGRAVVGTSVGSIPVTVGADAGWIAEPDSASIGAALVEALSSPEQLVAAGRAARRVYLATRMPGAVRPLADVYGELIASRRPG